MWWLQAAGCWAAVFASASAFSLLCCCCPPRRCAKHPLHHTRIQMRAGCVEPCGVFCQSFPSPLGTAASTSAATAAHWMRRGGSMHVYGRHLCSACGAAQGMLTGAASAALAGCRLVSLCLHCLEALAGSVCCHLARKCWVDASGAVGPPAA